MAVDAVESTERLPKEAGLVGLDGPLDELDLTKMLVENFEDNGPEETSPSGDAVEESTEEALRTLPAVRQAVDRAACANGQRVWKTNIVMQELTVADRSGQLLAVPPTGAVMSAITAVTHEVQYD